MSLFNSRLSSAPSVAASTQSQPQTPTSSSLGSAPQAQQPAGFTIDSVKQRVPTYLRNNVSQDLVDTLNSIAQDPIMAENIRDNFVSYTSVLKEGRFKLEEYLNAVSYVSYKIMGNTNEAVSYTHLDVYKRQHLLYR